MLLSWERKSEQDRPGDIGDNVATYQPADGVRLSDKVVVAEGPQIEIAPPGGLCFLAMPVEQSREQCLRPLLDSLVGLIFG